jgi:cytochrome c-type biogenesis protein
MIDTEGNVFGYVTGQLTADMMESIVTQTMTGQRVS